MHLINYANLSSPNPAIRIGYCDRFFFGTADTRCVTVGAKCTRKVDPEWKHYALGSPGTPLSEEDRAVKLASFKESILKETGMPSASKAAQHLVKKIGHKVLRARMGLIADTTEELGSTRLYLEAERAKALAAKDRANGLDEADVKGIHEAYAHTDGAARAAKRMVDGMEERWKKKDGDIEARQSALEREHSEHAGHSSEGVASKAQDNLKTDAVVMDSQPEEARTALIPELDEGREMPAPKQTLRANVQHKASPHPNLNPNPNPNPNI